MKRPRYFFAATIFVIIFGIVLVLGAAVYVPYGNPPQKNLSADMGAAPEKGDLNQVDDVTFVSSPTESIPTQETPLIDGYSLLETHCAQCHTVQKLIQIKKSRSQWEIILKQMEAMGALLSDSERNLLLKYLVTASEP